MQPDATPEQILQILSGFMASQHLFVACDLGVFEYLADEPADVEELSDRIGVPRRSLEIVTDAMLVLGLLEKRNGRFENSPASAAFLSGKGPGDLRPLVRFSHKLAYSDLANYAEAVRQGGSAASYPEDDRLRWYSEGVAAQSIPQAQALAGSFDFGRHKRVLDLGGGLGVFLEAVLQQHSGVEGTLFDQALVIDFAKEHLKTTPQIERIRFEVGNFFEDAIPPGHDAIVLANIIHNFPPDMSRRLLQRVSDQSPRGARAWLVDFWTDATHTDPPLAAILAGLLFTYSGGGAYSVAEGKALLAESGWKVVDYQPLAGPASVIVAENN